MYSVWKVTCYNSFIFIWQTLLLTLLFDYNLGVLTSLILCNPNYNLRAFHFFNLNYIIYVHIYNLCKFNGGEDNK